MSKRKNHAPLFKSKVALAALVGEKTLSELSSEFGVHQSLIRKWMNQLKTSVPDIFSGKIKAVDSIKENEVHELHAKIGQHIVERDFLGKELGAWGQK